MKRIPRLLTRGAGPWAWTTRSNMLCKSRARLRQASRINQAAHRGNAIGGDAGSARMLPDSLLVRCKVDAINLVFRDITMQPLNLRPHLIQGLQRVERELADLRL